MGVMTDLKNDDVAFSYVYDCGSDQLKTLKREMDKAKSYLKLDHEKLDVVYISHLDSDHVNGFDLLCEMVDRKIDKVVLPYLDTRESCYQIAYELSRNHTSGLYLEYLCDPVEWVKKRVPEAQIVLLQPSEIDDETVDTPEINNESSWQNNTLLGNALETNYRELTSYSWAAHRAPSSAGGALISLLSWIPPRSRKAIDNFAKELAALGFGRMTRKRLTDILKDPAERKILRGCFLKLASDHNVISINLLVKNIAAANFRVRNDYVYRNRFHPYYDANTEVINQLGVIMTGDSNLLTQRYYSKWLGFFKANAGDFNVMTLPHHGSTLNFNSRLLVDFNKVHFLAQSDGKSHGHPSTDVIEKIRSYKNHYYSCVDESSESIFEIEYLFPG